MGCRACAPCTGRYAEALELTDAAIREEGGSSLWMNWSLKGTAGEILVECGDVDRGIGALREAITLFEARRAITASDARLQTDHFASRAWVYRSLLSALFTAGRYEEALEMAERVKARTLEDTISPVFHRGS